MEPNLRCQSSAEGDHQAGMEASTRGAKRYDLDPRIDLCADCRGKIYWTALVPVYLKSDGTERAYPPRRRYIRCAECTSLEWARTLAKRGLR